MIGQFLLLWRFQNQKYPFTVRMLEEMFNRKSVRGIYSSNLKTNLWTEKKKNPPDDTSLGAGFKDSKVFNTDAVRGMIVEEL